MPIRSRLLGLTIILVGASFPGSTWAKTDNTKSSTVDSPVVAAQTVAPAPTSTATPVATIPLATLPVTTNAQTTSTPNKAAPVVESHKMEPRKHVTNACGRSEENHLQKSLLVAAFPRLIPATANAGELYQVEYQVPQLLSQQLADKHTTITPIQLQESLPLSNLSNETQLAAQTQRLAQSQHSQFVLSGEILDMSMAHPEATYNPDFYTRVLNNTFDFLEKKSRFEKRDRLFSFQIKLRDGFTGQQIFSQHYNTYGVWAFTGNVGFGTARFWQSDYGQQINGLIKKAAKDVNDIIQCQPFMAQVDSRPGQTQIILQGGTNNGLHLGDKLALYQLVVQGSETQYQQSDVRLVNRNAAIEVREVYPSHSVGVVSGNTYLAGQFLAVVP